MLRLPLILIAAAYSLIAGKPDAEAWIFKPCELAPVNAWNFRYEACGDTTTYKSLNRAFALKLEPGPDLAGYRRYRNLESAAQTLLGLGAVLFFMDYSSAKFIGAICSPSVNPACEEKSFTSIPPVYYLGFFTLTIPMNFLTTRKRMGYQARLISSYNLSLHRVHP